MREDLSRRSAGGTSDPYRGGLVGIIERIAALDDDIARAQLRQSRVQGQVGPMLPDSGLRTSGCL
jgi:hypothetical protein